MKLELNVSLKWGLPVVIIKPDRSEIIEGTEYTIDDCISEDKRLCCFSETYISPMCNYAIGVSGLNLYGLCLLNKEIDIISLKGQNVINGSFTLDTNSLDQDLDIFKQVLIAQGFTLLSNYDRLFTFFKSVKKVIDDQIERYHLMRGEILVQEYNQLIYQKYLDIDEVVSTMTQNQTQLQQLESYNKRLTEQQSYVDNLKLDKISVEAELEAKKTSQEQLEQQSNNLKEEIRQKQIEKLKLNKDIENVKKGVVPDEYQDMYNELC